MTKEMSREDICRPAAQGAAILALRLLDDVVKRRNRLADPSDDEALHDFRVALRRLRSWLRAFRPHLDDHIRKRTRRRLSRLADASSAGRDAEVQIAWLREQRHDLSAKQREGLDWLMARLESREHDADADLRRRIERDFDRAYTELEALHDVADDTPIDDASAAPASRASLAAAAVDLVHQHAEEVRRHLAVVRSLGDESETHQARIAGKRLRYLLEPFAGHIPESHEVIDGLQALQDATGELHDSHVLLAEIADALLSAATDRARRLTATMHDDDMDANEERATQEAQPDPEAGLLALGRRVRARSKRAFSEVEETWLHGRADALLARALTVADRLDALANESTPAQETRKSSQEVERKYLLRALPQEVGSAPSSEIEQGYLPGMRLAERLRHTVDTGDGDRREQWFRTVKLGDGVSRTEVEEETPRELFDAMWPLTEGRRVRKRRYRVPDGALTWEIDEFLDRELVIAEVELERADVAVEPPVWLSPHVVREVTTEPEYLNRNLAR